MIEAFEICHMLLCFSSLVPRRLESLPSMVYPRVPP